MTFLSKFFQKEVKPEDIWARPNMFITFRAEIMPGKTKEERTFKIIKVLSNGRVELENFAGEHRQSEFEQVTQSK